ncbi:MAG: hypothetical protein E3J75_03420 [Dehalococcoidia bacterium]|nr:MAG: hypothetical protein E3J75_03420 [Dehalococcoidia bacterium]
MRSSKTLYIILIIALAIFVISWAIGRPVWQAALFSIGFLLVAAIVSSRGLLIPEGLFGSRRLPRRFQVGKPSEGTDKTDKAVFLERMDSDLTDLSTQPGATTEDIHWMTEYTRVMKEVGELVYAVHESVRSKDRVKELRAFREVAKELPRLISQFKDIPELAIPKRRKAIEQQTQGLDLYLEACSNFAEALETSDGELAGQAAIQISKALDLLDIMDKSQLLRGK